MAASIEYSYEEDIAAQREEAMEEGLEKGIEKTTINLLKMNLGSPEQIAQASGLPLQKVLELQEEIKVKV